MTDHVAAHRDQPALVKADVCFEDRARTWARPFDPDEGDTSYYLLPAQMVADSQAAQTALDRAADAIEQYIAAHKPNRIYPD